MLFADVVVQIGDPRFRFFGAFIAVGAAFLIFGIPLFVRLVSRKPPRPDAAPTWVLALLGLGVPLVTGIIGVVATYSASEDFDRFTLHPDGSYTLTDTFSGSEVKFNADDIDKVEIKNERRMWRSDSRSDYYVAVIRLKDGRVFRSERVENLEYLRRRLRDAGFSTFKTKYL